MEEKCPHCGKDLVDGICPDCKPGEKIPWERRKELGFWGALFENAKMVITRPPEFFERMNPKGGYWNPLLYAWLICIPVVIIVQIWNLTLRSSILGMFMNEDFARMMGLGVMGFGIIGLFWAVIMSMIIIPIGLFIGAGIFHLMLIILGEGEKDFNTTFSVVSYSQTSSIANVIPVLGGLIALVWGTILNIIGLHRAHKITTGKSALAVLLPSLCCILVAVLALVVLAISAL